MDRVVTEKLNEFFNAYKELTFQKQEVLIRADEDPNGVYFITQGTVKQYAISQKGEELIVHLIKPPAFFPMTWAMAGEPNSFFFEALEEVRVRRAPKDDVLAFLKQNPDVLYDLTTRILRGLSGILNKTVALMSGTAYNRLVTEIVTFARRFGIPDGSSTSFAVTEMELASLAGLTRETVSREIKVLKQKGLLTFTKGIITIPSLSDLAMTLTDENPHQDA